MRILLAEDDELLGGGLRAGLDQRGFQVDWVRDGVAAERELLGLQHQAAVLDIGLPRQDGLAALQAVRARGIDTPVLILTARDAVAQRIEGLNLGADAGKRTLCEKQFQGEMHKDKCVGVKREEVK